MGEVGWWKTRINMKVVRRRIFLCYITRDDVRKTERTVNLEIKI